MQMLSCQEGGESTDIAYRGWVAVLLPPIGSKRVHEDALGRSLDNLP